MSATAPLAQSRERIHQVALRLFARHGFDGVSLQMIADEVGLHKSSLFHHYRGKLELASDVIEAALARLVDKVAPLEAGGPPELNVLLQVSDALVDHFFDEPESARLFVMLMSAPPESSLKVPISDAPGHPVVRVYSALWQWLERARKTRAIRAVNVRQTILNLIGLQLFYPAVAPTEHAVAGDDPFSAKARATRKRELRWALSGMLAP